MLLERYTDIRHATTFSIAILFTHSIQTHNKKPPYSHESSSQPSYFK